MTQPTFCVCVREYTILYNLLKEIIQDFPGGSLVRNLPANVVDTGSVPGLGRFHMPQLLSPDSKALELQLPKPSAPRACALPRDKPSR